MTDDQRAKLMMYHRVANFLTTNLADFAGTIVGALLTELALIIEAIHAAAAIQELGTAVPTKQREKARNKLLKLLQNFEDTGKAIGVFLGDEAVVAAFNLSPAYSEMADEELVTSADALKTAATPYSTEFQERGFPATYLADLQAARDAFHNTLAGANTVQATETIVQKIARADVIIAQFDVTVGNRYDADDPATAPKKAAYDSARTVIRRRTQPLTVTLTATRSGNDVTGNVTISRAAEASDTVTLRWREQDSTGVFTDGPVTTFPVDATTATSTVTVTTASPVSVIARVIRGDGSQFDSAAVVV